MLINGRLSSVNERTITIPVYHKGHLSLMTGTDVTLCYLPANGAKPSLEELLISPIPFQSWRYLTRINARMEDNPGAIERLVCAIEDMALNILYEASGSIENNLEQKKLIRVEFLVDASNYYKTFGDESLDDHVVLGKLERYLKAVSFDDLLLDGKRLRLKVRPMEGLRSAYALNPKAVQSKIKKECRIELPDELESIFDRRCYLVSDTKDHVLRAYFLQDDDDFMCIRISHNNDAQALSRITSRLSDEFIILTSLSRIKRRETEEVEFMLYSRRFPLRHETAQRIQLLQELFASSRHAFDISIDRWLSDTKTWEKIPLLHSQDDDRLDTNRVNARRSTCLLLEKEFRAYQERSRCEPNHALSRWYQRKCDAAYDLLLSEQSERVPSQIFISYRFDQPSLFDRLKTLLTASDSECTVINGAYPHDPGVDSNSFREVIIKRIYSSCGFVGIWKSEGDSEGDSKSSKEASWLLWELSIANAFGLPFLLFVHKNFQSSFHKTILSEQLHIPFEDEESDLIGLARKNLPLFQRRVSAFHKKNWQNFNSYSRYN